METVAFGFSMVFWCFVAFLGSIAVYMGFSAFMEHKHKKDYAAKLTKGNLK